MTSNIDASIPADNVQASKADLRANFEAAKDEIEALQGAVGVARQLAFVQDRDLDIAAATNTANQATADASTASTLARRASLRTDELEQTMQTTVVEQEWIKRQLRLPWLMATNVTTSF